MYLDESAWVALGFVIFVLLVWKKAGKILTEMLDARAEAIRGQLEDAKKLRQEAKKELDACKAMKAEAETEAKAIIKNAELAAGRLRAQAAQKTQDNIKRRDAQAMAKIQAAQNSMLHEIREKATRLALTAAREIITEKLDEKAARKLVDQSIKQISAIQS